MIRHQAISVESAAAEREQALQMQHIESTIVVSEEALLPVVATMADVDWNAGKHQARASWHDNVNEQPYRGVDDKNVVCP